MSVRLPIVRPGQVPPRLRQLMDRVRVATKKENDAYQERRKAVAAFYAAATELGEYMMEKEDKFDSGAQSDVGEEVQPPPVPLAVLAGEPLLAIEDIYLLDRADLAGPAHAEEDIDCILYTSPSARDATLSRMPSSA